MDFLRMGLPSVPLSHTSSQSKGNFVSFCSLSATSSHEVSCGIFHLRLALKTFQISNKEVQLVLRNNSIYMVTINFDKKT